MGVEEVDEEVFEGESVLLPVVSVGSWSLSDAPPVPSCVELVAVDCDVGAGDDADDEDEAKSPPRRLLTTLLSFSELVFVELPDEEADFEGELA